MRQRDNKRQPPNQSRNFRNDEKLTQSDVAFLLNIKNAGRISEWENDLSNPSLEHLLTLGLIYHRQIEDIYYELRRELFKKLEVRRKLLLDQKEKKQPKPNSS